MHLRESALAYLADDNSLNVYDLELSALSLQVSLAHLKSANRVYWQAPSCLLTCSNDGSAKLWDLRA